MSGPRIPGVTLEYRPKGRKKPYLVIVDTKIGGAPVFGSQSHVTEAEAEVAYAEAAARVTRLRVEAAEQARLKAALKVPALPQAPKGVVLFETLALRWLEDAVKPPMRTASTYLGYLGLLERHLFPVMRTWPVTTEVMSRERLMALLKDDLRKKGVGLPTRVACQRCLSAFFTWALLDAKLPPGQLLINPALKLADACRDKKTEAAIVLDPKPNPMTREQVEAFLAWQQAHYPALWEFFVWLVDAGSRVGEVSAIKWRHLDLGRGKAHVVDAYSGAQRQVERLIEKEGGKDAPRVGLGGEKDTKTHRTDQFIDLSDRLCECLPLLKQRNLEAWMKRGRFGKEPVHVFLNSTCGPRRPDKIVHRAFRAGCDALGLVGQTGAPFTIHCLRDTFATLAILDGHHVGFVAMMLGHSNELTTYRHYYRWIRLVDENPLRKRAAR